MSKLGVCLILCTSFPCLNVIQLVAFVLIFSTVSGCGTTDTEEPSAPEEASFIFPQAVPETWLFVVDDRDDAEGEALRAHLSEAFLDGEMQMSGSCRSDPAVPNPRDRIAVLALPSASGTRLISAGEFELRSHRASETDLADWALAVFSRLDQNLTADPENPFRWLATLSDSAFLLQGLRSPESAEESSLVSSLARSEVTVIVAASAHEDQSEGSVSSYLLDAAKADDAPVVADLVLPGLGGVGCQQPSSATPRLSAWVAASGPALGRPSYWTSDEFCPLSRLKADCVARCLDPSAGATCRLFVTAEVEKCPEELGWQDVAGGALEDGRRECEVRELQGSDRDRCEHDLFCTDCPPGYCFTEVPELIEECRSRGKEPLPRVVGAAVGTDLQAAFRVVCQ